MLHLFRSIMRDLLLARVTYAIATWTTLVFAGCATKTDRVVDTTQGERTLERSPQAPSASGDNGGGSISIDETPRPDIASTESPYSRPPLHEPSGSTYSDVGMPYPLPSVPAQLPHTMPTAPPPETPPSFETSFGPAPASNGAFPETSFGPTPASNESLPESSFGPDAEL
jgi:hypothetical protein